ncbi:MAG: damage-control phosphatase ARMT1 family protein [Chloroflexota bacterium]|nr:damage-control phosphatase ARMT1 family protein [Chloroflexota bacterium]
MFARSFPPPVRTDDSNPFAHHTVGVRLPSIARDTITRNPDYPPRIVNALETLARDLESDAPIRRIDDALWAPLLDRFAGDTWLHTEWFFAEVYFYRLIIEAVEWETTHRDPFAPHKLEELESAALRQAIFAASEAMPVSAADRLADRLLRSMWGNRIDLSLKEVAAHGSHGAADDVLIDDRAAVIAHLLAHRGGVVHVIADNAGTELAMDCLLIDALLDGADDDDLDADDDDAGVPVASQVILHVKAHPTFVSDATHDDVLTLLAELGGRGSMTGGFGSVAVAERLQAAIMDGRLVIRPDTIWNSGTFLFDLLDTIRPLFADAVLVIQKGDANYRRAIGDAVWETTALFADVTRWFPAPLLALRTLKSDPLVGLAPGRAESLEAIDPLWRVNGRRAIASWNRD